MIDERYKCYLCGRTGQLQRHHCLHGSRRKAADRFDLTVWLCNDCHRKLHDKGVGDLKLEQLAQRYFEDQYGHEKYMGLFQKNYIEER